MSFSEELVIRESWWTVHRRHTFRYSLPVRTSLEMKKSMPTPEKRMPVDLQNCHSQRGKRGRACPSHDWNRPTMTIPMNQTLLTAIHLAHWLSSNARFSSEENASVLSEQISGAAFSVGRYCFCWSSIVRGHNFKASRQFSHRPPRVLMLYRVPNLLYTDFFLLIRGFFEAAASGDVFYGRASTLWAQRP